MRGGEPPNDDWGDTGRDIVAGIGLLLYAVIGVLLVYNFVSDKIF